MIKIPCKKKWKRKMTPLPQEGHSVSSRKLAMTLAKHCKYHATSSEPEKKMCFLSGRSRNWRCSHVYLWLGTRSMISQRLPMMPMTPWHLNSQRGWQTLDQMRPKRCGRTELFDFQVRQPPSPGILGSASSCPDTCSYQRATVKYTDPFYYNIDPTTRNQVVGWSAIIQ